ncbi:MAG: FAD-dependent oxidoreductase, partial [Clostridia bacterium]|nr:FAD-dependent oxidoreductase [Clostridia bacterium]
EELIKLSIKYGFDNLDEKWGGSGTESREKRYATNYSPTIFSIMLDKFVLDSGVTLRFDTWATYPVMEGNHCKGVICESVGGREFFEAKVVIDATGDATICHRAGMPTVLGENFMTYVAHAVDKKAAQDYLNDGKMTTLRKWYGAGSNLEGVGPPESMGKLKGDTAEDITAYVVTGKQMLLEKFKDKPRNEFDITKLPTMAQFRTIRRIVGAEDFNAIEGETYENSIGNIGDFRYSGKHYQIPYGALYNPGFDNLLACGRIISAPQGDGWEVARVIPTCALTGEVAGKGAANAIDNNMSVSKVNVKELLR